MKFSERETFQFVKAYFRHENLWNTGHLAYKSHERRLVSYKSVIEDFKQSTGVQLTLSELRVKIKNLKSTYSQELDKIRRRSSGDYTYKPAMKWFAVWDKHIRAAKSGQDESNTTDDENQKTWLPIEAEDNENSIDPFESNQSNEYVMIIKNEPTSKQDESNSYDTNRTRKNLECSPRGEMSDLPTEYLNTTNLMKEDEFDIYGKYIASQLRSMDIQRALTLQIEIQNLVSGARLADLSERSSGSNIS